MEIGGKLGVQLSFSFRNFYLRRGPIWPMTILDSVDDHRDTFHFLRPTDDRLNYYGAFACNLE
jgi:hypothetical protein